MLGRMPVSPLLYIFQNNCKATNLLVSSQTERGERKKSHSAVETGEKLISPKAASQTTQRNRPLERMGESTVHSDVRGKRFYGLCPSGITLCREQWKTSVPRGATLPKGAACPWEHMPVFPGLFECHQPASTACCAKCVIRK